MNDASNSEQTARASNEIELVFSSVSVVALNLELWEKEEDVDTLAENE